MNEKYLKAFVNKSEENKEEGTLSVAVATDNSIDRDNERINSAGWDFTNFEKNPVLLWAHDYRQEPIGKVTNIRKQGNKILFTPKFAVNESKRAREIYDLYKGGYLNAFSVGFKPLEWKDSVEDGKNVREFTKAELLEISAVPVPANPNATVRVRGMKNIDPEIAKAIEDAEKDIDSLESKTVVPFKDEGIVSDMDTAWSGTKEFTDGDIQDVEKMKQMCAWYDTDSEDVKSAYKLPHHRASDLHAVWRGVSAAMAVLLGAKGGVDIPESDRKGVYNHLKQHYAQFGKEAPEYKLVEAQVLKDIDLDTDAVAVIHIVKVDSTEIKSLSDDVKQLQETVHADNGNQKEPSDALTLDSPEFNRKVLVAIDQAVGKALRSLNQTKDQ